MIQTGIIGGGASGMMAAIVAARSGAKVTILEKRDRVGKKILATGNGKCNLSNRNFEIYRDYRSHELSRLPQLFEQFGVRETIHFFEKQGMLLTDREGYLYPRSGQAATVLDYLREELERLSITIVCSICITDIRAEKKGFTVYTEQGRFFFDTLVLAGGSAAGTNPKEALGLFDIARRLGLKLYEPLPALTALRCKGSYYKAMAGVRCPARVTLHIDGKKQTYSDTGELQLTDYGISGIPVFQVSRYAAEALAEGTRVKAAINFMPEIAEGEWEAFCRKEFQTCLGRTAEHFANGMLPKKVAGVLLSQCKIRPEEILSDKLWPGICSFYKKLRSFEAEVTATNPVENAQVCMGGVALSEVNDSLESIKLPGLFLCGEMLDVDGRCGGYNLQWAWTSGQIAGTNAAKNAAKEHL